MWGCEDFRVDEAGPQAQLPTSANIWNIIFIIWSNLWLKNAMPLSQNFLTSSHTRPGYTSLTAAQLGESFSWNHLFRLHREPPGGRPLGHECQQHTGDFTERGTLQVTWKVKALGGLGESEDILGTWQSWVFTSWKMTPLSYMYTQHFGFVSWACMLLSDRCGSNLGK